MRKISLTISIILIILLLIIILIPTVFGKAYNKFSLQPLPYSYDALEPYIDTETMKIHHDKHHKAYVDNLNNALEKHPELYNKSLEYLIINSETLPNDIKTTVINNAGGDYNHTLFWNIMTPKSTKAPKGELLKSINQNFGSFENFKKEFKDKSLSVFGSGWTFLVSDDSGNLSIITTANQNTPLPQNLKPIILLDLWEHAYYLKHKNLRADYIDNWWNVVNWEQANKNYNM